jgi:predicted ATPase
MISESSQTIFLSHSASLETQFFTFNVIGKITQQAISVLKQRSKELYEIFEDDTSLSLYLPLLLDIPFLELPSNLMKPNETTNSITGEARIVKLALLLKKILEALISLEKVLIVIEDIQWLDALSAKVLSLLTFHLGSSAMFIFNTRLNGSLLAELHQQPNPITHIKLDRLQLNAVESIIENVIDAKPDKLLTEKIFEKSNGNPFYGKIRYFEIVLLCLFI